MLLTKNKNVTFRTFNVETGHGEIVDPIHPYRVLKTPVG